MLYYIKKCLTFKSMLQTDLLFLVCCVWIDLGLQEKGT